jgi:uncharacterized membrane protein YuzA (DUF378 family)
MDKTGDSMIAKVLLGIALLLTILMGLQALTLGAMSLGILTSSLFSLLGNGSISIMKGIYVLSGISAIITAIILFLKVYTTR